MTIKRKLPMRLSLLLLLLTFSAASVCLAGNNPARQAAQQRGTEAPADGVWYVYDRQGKLLREEHYQSYRLQGDVKTFYPNGTLKDWSIYIDGVRQGPTKTYYPSGNLQSQSTYLDNNLNGYSHRYYETGELQSVAHYRNGNLDGEFKDFHPNGQVKRLAYYEGGVLDGSVLYYNETGQVIAEEQYQNATLLSRREFNLDSLTSGVHVQTPAAVKVDEKKLSTPSITPSTDVSLKDSITPKP
jgi:hypothetical protein